MHGDAADTSVTFDLESALSAAAAAAGDADTSAMSDAGTLKTNDFDMKITNEALAEMYELDFCLQGFKLQAALREKLLTGFKQGYEEGGAIAKAAALSPVVADGENAAPTTASLTI